MWVLSCFSHVWFFATLWTVACQAPLSMGFSRQEYWSGLPCPPQGDLTDSGIEPESLKSPALAGGFFTTSPSWEAQQRTQKGHKIVYMWSFKPCQQVLYWSHHVIPQPALNWSPLFLKQANINLLVSTEDCLLWPPTILSSFPEGKYYPS